MLHTVFSNSYEVLREALHINLSVDNRKRTEGASIFRQTEVVVPSEAMADALRRHFADRDGICAGIAFKSIGQWFIKYGRPLIGMGEAGSELEFLLWQTMQSPEFVSAYPRLESFLTNKTPAERYGFAMHVAAVFSRYSTYRLDWVLQWMGVKSEADFPCDERTVKEKQALARHPDASWQQALWRELARRLSDTNAAEDLRNLARIEDRMIEAGHSASGETVHIFMPFALPPLVLPMLKKIAEGEFSKSADVCLYLLNPSSEYWYESVSRKAGKWTESDSEPVLAYLRRNAASTRAVIERVYAFLNLDGAVSLIGVEPEDCADGESRFETRRVMVGFDPVNQRVQDLQLDSVQEADGYYVEPGTATLLRRLQSVVLTLSDVAACGADVSDGSVCVCCAPGRIREVENLVDWLHSLFAADSGLKPEDVLVVTPDIDATAGVIEAVMSAQPENRRLPWSVIAPQSSRLTLAVQSWEKLVKFFFSRAERSEFEAWLELPLVLKRWSMTAADLAVIHAWLVAGGYRFGLSEEHVASLHAKNMYVANDTDGTLMRALERLAVGFFSEDEKPVVFGDVTGANGSGWQESVVDNGDLFNRFVALASTLEEKRRDLVALGQEAAPAALRDFFSGVAATFLDFSDEPEARLAIESSLTTVVTALTRTLGDGVPVAPEVFAKSACAHVADAAPHRSSSGITFAGMSDFRGIPFKVVAILGLDHGSAFPGFNRTEEFDLMAAGRDAGVMARRGDRDSRLDNRNIFFDLFMAAREKFFISYSQGWEKSRLMPPSVVVEDFLAFASEVTGRSDLAQAVTVYVPLTTYSRRNFAEPEHGGRPWKSPDVALLGALRTAEAEGYAKSEAVFADGADVLAASDATVGADAVVQYIDSPDRFVLKRFGLFPEELAEKEDSVSALLTAATSPLEKNSRVRRVVALALSGVEEEQVRKSAALDPENGAEGVRETVLADEIHNAFEAVRRLSALEKAGEIPMTTVPVSGFSFVKAVRFPALKLYRAPHQCEPPFAAILTYSDSDRRRQLMMQCLRNALLPQERCDLVLIAADKNNDDAYALRSAGYCLPTGSSEDCADTVADHVLHSFMPLFDALGTAAAVVPGRLKTKDMMSAEEKLLWRGRLDCCKSRPARDFGDAVKEFFKEPLSVQEGLNSTKLEKLRQLENAAQALFSTILSVK